MKQVMEGVITDLEQKRSQTSLSVMGVCIPLALCGAQKGLFLIGNGGGPLPIAGVAMVKK